jgi:adenine-specific DNA-methyltransferase
MMVGVFDYLLLPTPTTVIITLTHSKGVSMSFYTKLTDLLKTNPNFVDDEGELLLAAVQDRAWKLDHDLIRLLLSDDEMKEKFFDVVDSSLLFKTNTFIEYISQKNFLDNSYTRFRNRIGLTIDGKYLSERGEVALAWAYKDCVLEGGQTREEEKRKEIFFNEVLAQDEINRMSDPKVLTNFTRYTTTGAQPVKEFKRDENGVIQENLIIKGNNLIALHTLKEQFRGKVKLIYIDPPYNTGNDSFGYNDNFNHSTWLTFMKNRLEVAKDFLSPNGSIFISCDDNEQAYLKIVCDEIFNRKNYVGLISVAKGTTTGQDAKLLGSSVDFLLVYAKDIQYFVLQGLPLSDKDLQRFTGEDSRGKYSLLQLRKTGSNDRRQDRPNLYYSITAPDGSNVFPIGPTGYESTWRFYPETYKKFESKGLIEWKIRDGHYVPYVKYYAEGRTKSVSNLWNDIEGNKKATHTLKSLFDGEKAFANPKPVGLIKKIIKVAGVSNDEYVLDFFAGSGTTAHAAVEMKNEGLEIKFILCEQLKYVDTVTKERVVKSIEKEQFGDFIYCELMKYNQSFIDRIQDAENTGELLQIWQDMTDNSFLNWYVNPKVPEDAINDFIEIGNEENGLVKQKKLLMELLDKNQLYVNLSEIDDAKFNVSDVDKRLNKAFYGEI